jgi:hypothetical protein
MLVITHLLFGLVTSARPFGDNVLLGLGVCRKGEGDTRESSSLRCYSMLFRHLVFGVTYEINSHNQLSLAAIGVARNFSGTASWVLIVHVLHSLLLLLHLILGIGTAISWWLRGTHLLRVLTHVSLAGIDRGGVMTAGELLLSWGHRTLGTTGGGVIRVAGRAAQLLRIHRKTGLGGGRRWRGTGGGGCGGCV